VKIGLLSDIHGNLEALEAVLARMREARVDRIWCLGDVVGYGADPNACAALVRESAETTVLGNHDAACVGAEDLARFNPLAREAILWTQSRLDESHRAWLKTLPLTESVGECLLVHASPFEPAAWHYIHLQMRSGDVPREFAATAARCAFVGHSHQQLVLVKRQDEFFLFHGASLTLEPGHRYLVNVGSAGQPRDGDPRAAWALYDTEAGRITLERATYDIAAAQRKIRAAGLPAALADRLEAGR
jgi:diadenosine tetraphosphatase ApaH/serine/threonine PP2A family protein phosphatase